MSQPLRHVPETCMSGGQISGEDERTGTVSSCRIYEKKVMKHCMFSKKKHNKEIACEQCTQQDIGVILIIQRHDMICKLLNTHLRRSDMNL